MQFGGFDIKNSLCTIGCFSTGNFGDIGKGIAFVQQSQFSFRFIRCARIHEDPALDKISMYISYHAADITLRIGPTIVYRSFLTFIDVFLYPFVILEKIPMVTE